MKDKPVILIVDDQPQNIELLEAHLVPQGYEIVKAASGEEALVKLSGNQIDLILLDVLMPGIDGFEVTRRVRQHNTHRLIPIILVTALWKTQINRVKGIEAGCDDFISKPVDKVELLARVRSLLKVKAYNDLMSNYRKELESEVASSTEELKHTVENLKQEITEREMMLEAQLNHAMKMETIGRLAGGIAHDFDSILSSAGFIIEELKENDPMREDAQKIKEAAYRAAALTEQLLAFSRKETIKPEILNLNNVITKLEKMLRRIIGEDLELSTALDKDLGNVKVDWVQMEQVLANLAVNARDAMPDGGKLTIETQNVYLDEQYSQGHTNVMPGNYVMLAISDTGSGMDVETLSKIFEPFFTTKEVGKQTGLGLATVYGIVKQNNGYILAYSELGQGTSLKIYLPLIESSTVSVKAVKISADDSLKGS